jgi:putative ABC transport system ATP-binding protein
VGILREPSPDAPDVSVAHYPDAAAAFVIGGRAGPVDVMALIAADDRAGAAALRARRIGFVLQTGGLAPFLTVAENVALPLRLAGRRDDGDAAQVLEALGLGALKKAWPADLSVGQRQRVAVARAVVHRPALLLADEPTAALDPEAKAITLALILDLAARFGAAVLIATHERDLFADRAVRRLTIRTAAAGAGVEARLEETA